MPIAFIDLQAQRARIADKIDAAIARVLADGRFIMGPDVSALEQRLSAFSGAAHTLSCANGTDAIALPLMAWEVGPGDAVFCPSFTFAATAEVIPWVGATPVFVDILPNTYNMDPAHLESAIGAAKRAGLAPKVVIAVDLFGQPADYPSIAEIARRHGCKLIADSAQSFGCTLNGQHPIVWADAVTTSFFPAKPLGCYGDGGAVQTNDASLWDTMDSLRIHGKASQADVDNIKFDHDPKYLNSRIGMNSRLDTLQAAILIEKLVIFADEIALRQQVAARYNALLEGHVLQIPPVIAGGVSTWAQYTIEVADRDATAAALKAADVPSAVYYPVPMHRQAVYAALTIAHGNGLPVTDAKANTVISLPMHPYLDEKTQDYIVAAVRAAAQ